ncbi:hypothetical protein [Flammeovirga aprica]|uniref:Uncharacterized protein n=1 Tax=Flammeovirga aprica JL-4 TaxID=694437 RepID=A0A7X9S109_9BACT|nr:hypothetical protein [Flammeovirga aprica]NME72420.1 hypothetical protein [Flammeovirga aprica JL-4]
MESLEFHEMELVQGGVSQGDLCAYGVGIAVATWYTGVGVWVGTAIAVATCV